MKNVITAFILLAMSVATLSGQSEYRIKQDLPNSIDSLYIRPGWIVKLHQAPQSSITIVTPCQAFYDDANEPQVCTVEGNEVTLNENSALPRSTVLEIALAAPIKRIMVWDSANVTTEQLTFAQGGDVIIRPNAIAAGSTWRGMGGMNVDIYWDSRLQLDSLLAEKGIRVECEYNGTFICPVVQSPDSRIKKDKYSLGTNYVSDSSIHLNVKRQNERWLHKMEKLSISFGLAAPVPLYMNNKSGSAYNRAENYNLYAMMGLGPIRLTKRLNLHPRLIEEVRWSRLLNQVSTDGNSLTLSDAPSAEAPQQHLMAGSMGLDLTLSYAIGKLKKQAGVYPMTLNWGLSALMTGSQKLITRTLWSDNRWHKVRTEVDVFNPFQLRAHVGISGGPITSATLSLFYDLLPTFRSGIGAKNVHTFGVTLSL